MLGREEDEQWAGAKPLQPRTWPPACSFPTEPNTQPKVLFCRAARPAAAPAPALVGSPPHPPQLSSALYPGLCQVGAGEWPFHQPRAPSTLCLPKSDHYLGPATPISPNYDPLQASPDLTLNSPPCWPTSVAPHSVLWVLSGWALSPPGFPGSLVVMAPWKQVWWNNSSG